MLLSQPLKTTIAWTLLQVWQFTTNEFTSQTVYNKEHMDNCWFESNSIYLFRLFKHQEVQNTSQKNDDTSFLNFVYNSEQNFTVMFTTAYVTML